MLLNALVHRTKWCRDDPGGLRQILMIGLLPVVYSRVLFCTVPSFCYAYDAEYVQLFRSRFSYSTPKPAVAAAGFCAYKVVIFRRRFAAACVLG